MRNKFAAELFKNSKKRKAEALSDEETTDPKKRKTGSEPVKETDWSFDERTIRVYERMRGELAQVWTDLIAFEDRHKMTASKVWANHTNTDEDDGYGYTTTIIESPNEKAEVLLPTPNCFGVLNLTRVRRALGAVVKLLDEARMKTSQRSRKMPTSCC